MRIIRFGKERPADVLYRRSQVGIIGRYGLEEFIVYDGDCQWKDRAVMRAIIDDVKFRASGELNEYGELRTDAVIDVDKIVDEVINRKVQEVNHEQSKRRYTGDYRGYNSYGRGVAKYSGTTRADKGTMFRYGGSERPDKPERCRSRSDESRGVGLLPVK